MPLVTLTVRKPKSSSFKVTVLDAVHAAIVLPVCLRRTNFNELSSLKKMTSVSTQTTLT